MTSTCRWKFFTCQLFLTLPCKQAPAQADTDLSEMRLSSLLTRASCPGTMTLPHRQGGLSQGVVGVVSRSLFGKAWMVCQNGKSQFCCRRLKISRVVLFLRWMRALPWSDTSHGRYPTHVYNPDVGAIELIVVAPKTDVPGRLPIAVLVMGTDCFDSEADNLINALGWAPAGEIAEERCHGIC